MNRLIVLGVLFFASVVGVQAQVSVDAPPEVTQMMERFIEINKQNNQVFGWRIQLLATTDRNRLDSSVRTFQYRYPNIPVDWVHEPPYFKLRAGAYPNKLEAMRMREILKNDYPSAYVAPDDAIRPEELVGF